MAILLLSYFVRKHKGCSSVIELNEEHLPVQIFDLTQDRRLFPKVNAPGVIPYWSDESAAFFDLFGFHVTDSVAAGSQHFVCPPAVDGNAFRRADTHGFKHCPRRSRPDSDRAS